MDARAPEWWQTRWFAAAAILLACVPLIAPPFPPLTDALDHAGRYRVMLGGGASPLAQWYSIEWRPIGNLGCDALMLLLGPLIGLEPAVKLIAMLIVALTVAGCLAISRVVHGRVSAFALFALPLAYNHPFHMGFLNFTLGMALALNALALWLWMRPGRRRALLFVAIALVIWGTHAFGWAVLALMIFAGEWRGRGNPIRAAIACWPLAAPLPLMFVWRAARAGATHGFFDIESKLTLLLMSFRDRWFVVDVLTLAVMLAVIAYGARRAGRSSTIAAAAVALLLAFLALPGWLMGSAFADMRAAPYVIMLALLALRPVDPAQARRIAALGLIVFVARIGVTTASLLIAGQAQAREAGALDHMFIGARVVQFVSPDCAHGWPVSRREHVGGLAQARRRAFVNSQWADVGASILATHYPAARPFENDPSQLLPCDDDLALRRRLARVPWAAFDRLWLVDIPGGPPTTLPGTTLLWRDGGSAVYRIDRR